MISFICSIVEDTDDQRFIIDLYHRYKKLMLMTARKYVADENGCEDIMQDSIVKLIQNIHVIRAKERCILASYIVSTVRNTSIDYLVFGQENRLENYQVWKSTKDVIILVVKDKE